MPFSWLSIMYSLFQEIRAKSYGCPLFTSFRPSKTALMFIRLGRILTLPTAGLTQRLFLLILVDNIIFQVSFRLADSSLQNPIIQLDPSFTSVLPTLSGIWR